MQDDERDGTHRRKRVTVYGCVWSIVAFHEVVLNCVYCSLLVLSMLRVLLLDFVV